MSDQTDESRSRQGLSQASLRGSRVASRAYEGTQSGCNRFAALRYAASASVKSPNS